MLFSLSLLRALSAYTPRAARETQTRAQLVLERRLRRSSSDERAGEAAASRHADPPSRPSAPPRVRQF
jgi:hypothetical protein